MSEHQCNKFEAIAGRWVCVECSAAYDSLVNLLGVRQAKYGNVPTTVDGITFGSKAEARRYRTLLDMARRGEIEDLCTHARWLLLPAFVDSAGQSVRGIWYEDDFNYIRDGRRVVEDVKGHRTATFRLKSKLFRARYRDVLFLVVEASCA